MKYQTLAELYDKLSATSSRLEKTDILADFLKKLKKNDREVMYLLLGDVHAEYDERRIGISNQLVIKALVKASGMEKKHVVKEWKELGDLGKVTEVLMAKKKQSTLHKNILTTEKVLENLKKLPELEGKGSVNKKMNLITELLSSASPLEALYLARTLIGDLRIGVRESTIRDALVEAFFEGKKEAKKRVQNAINKSNDMAAVFDAAKTKKFEKLEKIKLQVGKPIKVMLAQKAKNVKEAFKAVGKPAAVEFKYDGFRCVTGHTSIYEKKKGIISIKDIKVNDNVLTHKGNFKKVIAINKRIIDKKERLFELQSFLGNGFRITEKHRVFVCRNEKIQWMPVEKMKKSDELVFPLHKIKEKNILERSLKLGNSAGYEKNIPVNKFFFRFLGYWIGDGFTNNYHNTERCGIIFNKKTERKLCDYYKKNIKKYFGIKKISENIHNGAIYLYWRDKPFRIWLSKNFRREWKGKMLPDWFFGISKENFEEFLKGWIESDGHKDGIGRISITTKERDLATIAQLIALQFKKVIGIKKIRINNSTYYKIIIPKTSKYFRFKNKNLLVKIFKFKEINRPDPRIRLYNLQVEGDESYCTTLATLHNCLIHKKETGEIILFTRRLENVTKQFPEVKAYIEKYVSGKSFILDSEAVGFDKKTKEYKPFQEISQRIRRKYDIDKLKEKLPIEVNVFDALYYNGKSLLDMPFKKRSEIVRKAVKPHPYKIISSKQIITSSESKAQKFYEQALKDRQEGVMFKNLDAKYQPGSRVGHMLKIKPEERDLDLVITGAEYGTGKRSGWLSSFILSCYDEKKKKFLEIGKVGTGIKEKDKMGISFGELTKRLKPHITKEKGKKVYIKPHLVVSVTYQEIQHSPNYNSNFALRFPRFTALRPDRKPQDITTLQEVIKDYESQKRNYKYG